MTTAAKSCDQYPFWIQPFGDHTVENSVPAIGTAHQTCLISCLKRAPALGSSNAWWNCFTSGDGRKPRFFFQRGLLAGRSAAGSTTQWPAVTTTLWLLDAATVAVQKPNLLPSALISLPDVSAGYPLSAPR